MFVMEVVNIMTIDLYSHQKVAIENLRSGSILCGGVGSGKSRTALAYYFTKECNGKITKDGDPLKMKNPKDLYIITTARKRDTLEWERECSIFLLSKDRDLSINNVLVTVDSWNNIAKYIKVKDAFFIFDEQRVVGSGAWVMAFLKITKNNNWILLSATPGDTWMDYVPVFIANGYFKNRSEFIDKHVVYNRFTRYPKIDHYVNCDKLIRYRKDILVNMDFKRETIRHNKNIYVKYDKKKFDIAVNKRWNPYENKPIKDISELCFIMRRIVNSDSSRLDAVLKIFENHPKLIIFYNFNYELEALRTLSNLGITIREWNGQKHEQIPRSKKWIYLVQYTAGAEGWNCVETNAIIFYSQSYSYKIMEQSCGRIDRINTPYKDLYYYHLISKSVIDSAILKALDTKEDFNERAFEEFYSREKHMV